MTLTGYWPLTEDSGDTAYDYSGNGHDGDVNGASQGASGILGHSAYNFDGVDDYVNVGMNDFWDGQDSLTISTWVSTTDSDGVITGTSQTNTQVFHLKTGHNTAGDLRMYVQDEGGPDWSFYTTNYTGLDDGNYHHVVLRVESFSNNIGGVYVDGREREVTVNNTGNITLGPMDNGTYIGGQSNYDGSLVGPLDGTLTQFRIYGHALAPSEIQYLATTGQMGHGTYQAVTPTE